MRINYSPGDLFAGVDNLSLDTRKFHLSRDDIQRICRFFSLGHLQHYEKEKDIIVSHSNFLVYAKTTHGRYALKFYPPDAAKTIAMEYAINRVLVKHHFPTPVMHAGSGSQPFFTSNDRLATCYSYIDGLPAWQHLKHRNTIHKINTAMLSLKNILSTTNKRIPFLKQENLAITINNLAKTSRRTALYDQKAMMDASLRDAIRTYQHHQLLFTRRLVHNNITLTNMLICRKTVYTLDLTHVREDYALCDLASLVISCLFLDVPTKTINTIARDYFSQHKIEQEHFPVLNTLVKIGLIKEYLKNIQREKSIELSGHPADGVSTYLYHLSKRKKTITAVLKKMNDNSRFII